MSSAIPPLIPTPTPPPVYATKPPVVLLYRLWCGFFVLLYLSIVVFEILNSRGVVDPPMDIVTDLLTLHDKVARAEAVAEARKSAMDGAEGAALGAIFYGFAACIPRRRWAWTVGIVAIVLTFLPFMVTLAGTIPLIIAWSKPETKRYFGA